MMPWFKIFAFLVILMLCLMIKHIGFECCDQADAQPKYKRKKELPLCDKSGVNLVGRISVNQSSVEMEYLEKMFSLKHGGNVMKGGWYNPIDCRYRRKVAIVIPYRNRFEQLKIFLRHMHPLIQKQRLYYRIFVVEQLHDDPFNHAVLTNVGFLKATKLDDFDCFVFTDVDLLPEDDRNYYGCPTSPLHMPVAIDKFNYRLRYPKVAGGVMAFNKSHYEIINGYSNLYFGWGGEDNDLYIRIESSGFKLNRLSYEIGRYTMVKFDHFRSSKENKKRFSLYPTASKRIKCDGLNTIKYNLSEVIEAPLVTYIKVTTERSFYEDSIRMLTNGKSASKFLSSCGLPK